MHAGQVIQDRYLLQDKLGGGGMGEVWKALDQRLQRTVAIKLMAPQFVENPEFLVRFLREAQSIARISHPGVVAVLDFGESDETPFLVMEHVPGKPLSETTGDPMDPDKATGVIAQAAGAAGAAHSQGIVHRDIKPANIVITDEGRVKLVDFGIASLENMDRITATGTTIGSPHYISPEQASGDTATPRSDVYSLGVVLFELLTGARPFEGNSVAAVAAAQIEQDPPKPSTKVSGLDPWLERVVLKCLEKQPEERFADGNALAQELTGGPDASTMLIAAPPPPPDATQVLPAEDAVSYVEEPPAPEEAPAEEESDSPWRAALVGLLIGLLLLGAAVGVYAFLIRDDESTDPSPATEEQGGDPEPADPTSAPAEDTDGEEPPEDQPTEEQPPEDEPTEDDTQEEPVDDETLEEDPTDDETVEGDLEVDPDPNGRGPNGEGPPGQN